MLGQKRLSDISEAVQREGLEKAAEQLQLNLETLKRYLRWSRHSKETVDKKAAKVLLIDIETAPMVTYTWGCFKQNIGLDQIDEPSHMICWSAKWLFEPDVFSDTQTPQEAINRDDKRIVASLWEYIDDATVVVGHNVSAFDLAYANGRFMVHRMVPPSPYMVIDTLLQARKKMRLDSNRLDFIARVLGLPGKIHTDFRLWKGCMAGNRESLDNMTAYNKQDVNVLEEVYVRLRPWMASHPNLAMFADALEPRCHCGSTDLHYAGWYVTIANKYESWRCAECGSIVRSPKAVKRVTAREDLRYPIAR